MGAVCQQVFQFTSRLTRLINSRNLLHVYVPGGVTIIDPNEQRSNMSHQVKGHNWSKQPNL